MPALNFKKEFVPAIESGEKKHTIRKMRKRPFQKGDTVYLYYGMRTNACRKLGEGKVHQVVEIWIEDNAVYLGWVNSRYKLTLNETETLAIGDGFDNIESFFDFFRSTYSLPFHGQLIKW